MKIWASEIKELTRFYESFKGQLPDLEKELERLVKTDDENVVLVYARRCLEVIVNDLCECELGRPRKTEPLKGVIDKLNKEEKIPSFIITSMHNLNSLSTYGAHPREFDPRQVKPVLNNLATIIDWYLKYKDTRAIDKQITEEEHEIKEPDDFTKRFRKQKKRVLTLVSRLALFVVTVLIISVVISLFYSGTTIPFTERDWILIADFENITEEPIFDHSLNTAFMLGINQSRYINVIARQRMKETLKRMKKEEMQFIDEETGREIAMREGVNICLVPSISRVGTKYILTAKIQDAKTGTILKSEVLYADSQDEIIGKLDQLSRKIRRNLGESRYKISGQSKSLSKVTTSSLEALKQYSLGIESHINLDFDQARIHYENAIRIDSNFTAAKASLGGLLIQKFDPQKGREWLEQAMLTIDNLSDRERYGILAAYATHAENDLDKAIEYTKLLIELYPDDPVLHNNLGWYFQNQEHYEKAAEEYKLTLRIDPYMMLTYQGLISIYLDKLGQSDSAMTWSDQMIKYGPDNPWGYFSLGSAYVFIDSLKKAEIAYNKARSLDPELLVNQWRLAHVYRLQAMYDDAIEVLEEIFRINPEETFTHYDIGINYELKGESEHARSHFLELRKIAEPWLEEYPEHVDTYIGLGTILTRLGEEEAGWEIGKKAIEMDSTIHFRFAELLAVQDRKDEALDHLEKELENGYRDLVWLKLNPNLYTLHGEARYQALINNYFPKE